MLNEMFKEVEALSHYEPKLPAYDELTRAINGMLFENRPPGIWTAFAAQIMFDIHGEMGQEISCGLDDLQKVACDAHQKLRKKRKFTDLVELKSKAKPKWWTRTLDVNSWLLLADIEIWVFDDPVNILRTRAKDNRGAHSRIIPHDHFLQQRPVLWASLPFMSLLSWRKLDFSPQTAMPQD